MSIACDGPIRPLLLKPAFAFSRVLYPRANWPLLTVGLEEALAWSPSIAMGLTEFRVVEIRWGLGTYLYTVGNLVLWTPWVPLGRPHPLPFWPGLIQPRMALY